MRLDKFLKVSRIIKRRSVAKEIADQGRILVNDRPAKSSTKVASGDTLTIKSEAEDMYEIIDEKYAENFD